MYAWDVQPVQQPIVQPVQPDSKYLVQLALDDIPAALSQTENEQWLYFMDLMHLMNENKEQKQEKDQEPLYLWFFI